MLFLILPLPVALCYFAAVLFLCVFEPLIHFDCDLASSKVYKNPDFNPDPCVSMRSWNLLLLNRLECDMGRRMIAATCLGCLIGWERRQADRPAGIRTMGLVSLASSLFTLASALAFRAGPQSWDASRISAAIPSGVGFLGAGLIFKESHKVADGEVPVPLVHGLTTAASLWMSAAVGIACGGRMYFAATFACTVLMMLMRLGPRTPHEEDDDDDFDEEEQADMVGALRQQFGAMKENNDEEGMTVDEAKSLLAITSSMRQSRRQRPHLM